MSELQAILQARRQRVSPKKGEEGGGEEESVGDGGAGGDDSVNAVVHAPPPGGGDSSTLTTAAAAAAIPYAATGAHYQQHHQHQQQQQQRTKSWHVNERHSGEDGGSGIEVSPSAKGREALQLNQLDNRGPPSMPHGVSNRVVVGGGGVVRFGNNNAARGKYTTAHGAAATTTNVSQDPRDINDGGGGGNTAQDPRGNHHLRTEGSSYGHDDSGGSSPTRNELQKKLLLQRRRIMTVNTNDGGESSNAQYEVMSPSKSPRVAMKWNIHTMKYEPVTALEEEDGPRNNSPLGHSPPPAETSMVAKKRDATVVVEGGLRGAVEPPKVSTNNSSVAIETTTKHQPEDHNTIARASDYRHHHYAPTIAQPNGTSANATNTTTNAMPHPQQRGSRTDNATTAPTTSTTTTCTNVVAAGAKSGGTTGGMTATRKSTFFKRTAPSANSGTVVMIGQHTSNSSQPTTTTSLFVGNNNFSGQQQPPPNQQFNHMPTTTTKQSDIRPMPALQTPTKEQYYNGRSVPPTIRPMPGLQTPTKDQYNGRSVPNNSMQQQYGHVQQQQQQSTNLDSTRSSTMPVVKSNQNNANGSGALSSEEDQTSVGSGSEEDQEQQQQQPEYELQTNPSVSSTAVTDRRVGGVQPKMIGGNKPQVGGRPRNQREFSRTVAGRSRASSRKRANARPGMEEDSNPQKKSMLSIMAKKYKEQKVEIEQQEGSSQVMESLQVVGDELEKVGSSTMALITKRYKETQAEANAAQLAEYEDREEGSDGDGKKQPPQPPGTSAAATTTRSNTASGGGLNRWMQGTGNNPPPSSHQAGGPAGGLSGLRSRLQQQPPGSPASTTAASHASAGGGGSRVGSIASKRSFGGHSHTGSNVWSGVGSTAVGSAAVGGGGSNVGGGGSNVGSTNTDGSVPEFMKMRLRSTPGKRTSAMGTTTGDAEKSTAVVAIAPKITAVTSADIGLASTSAHHSEEQPHEEDGMLEEPEIESPPQISSQPRKQAWQTAQRGNKAGNARGRWQPPGARSESKDEVDSSQTKQQQQPSQQSRTVARRWQPPGVAKSIDEDDKSSSALQSQQEQSRNVARRWQPPGARSTATVSSEDENDAGEPKEESPGNNVRGRWQPPGGTAAKDPVVASKPVNNRYPFGANNAYGNTRDNVVRAIEDETSDDDNGSQQQAAVDIVTRQKYSVQPLSPGNQSHSAQPPSPGSLDSPGGYSQHSHDQPPSPAGPSPKISNNRFHVAAARARWDTNPSNELPRQQQHSHVKAEYVGRSWVGRTGSSFSESRQEASSNSPAATASLDPPLVDELMDETASDADIAELNDMEYQQHHQQEEEEEMQHQQQHVQQMHQHEQHDEEQQQPAAENMFISNYDTAVMAAKNAIVLSNSNRSRSVRSSHSPGGASLATSTTSISMQQEEPSLDDPEEMIRDPSLMMEASPEPSPSSSLVDEDIEATEEDETRGDPPMEEVPVQQQERDNVGGGGNGGGAVVKEDRLSQLARMADQYDDLITPTNNASSAGTPRAAAAAFATTPRSSAADDSPRHAIMGTANNNTVESAYYASSPTIATPEDNSSPNNMDFFQQPENVQAALAETSAAGGAQNITDFFGPSFMDSSQQAPQQQSQQTNMSHPSSHALRPAFNESPGHDDDDYEGFDAFGTSSPEQRAHMYERNDAFGSTDPFDPFSTGVFSYQHQNDSMSPAAQPPAQPDTPTEQEPEDYREDYQDIRHHHEEESNGGSSVKESPLFEAIFGESSSPGNDNAFDDLDVGTLQLTPGADYDDTATGDDVHNQYSSSRGIIMQDDDDHYSPRDMHHDGNLNGPPLTPRTNYNNGDEPPLTPGQESMAELSHISQQSSSYESSAASIATTSGAGGDEHDEEVDESSASDEDRLEKTSEEFAVNVSNFANGSIGSSMDDVLSLPHRHDHNVMTPRRHDNVHVVKEEHQETLGASFMVRPLNLAFCPEESDVQRIADPIENPLSGNLIVCRINCNGNFMVEEVDVTGSNQEGSPTTTTVVSANLVTDELKTKLSRCSSNNISNNVKVLGVSSILSLSAGVHRVQGRERVRVAALAELYVVGGSIGTGMNKVHNKMRVVLVWRWGYNPSGTALASLQSVLATSGINDNDASSGGGGYDPTTLQVGDGLLFLGGSISEFNEYNEQTSVPAVYIAKPAVRDAWTAVPIRNTSVERNVDDASYARKNGVAALSITHDTHPYLAVGFTDGSVQVVTYELAARTNRLASKQQQTITSSTAQLLLQPMCTILGEAHIANLGDSDCLWPNELFVSLAHRGGSSITPPTLPSYNNSAQEEEVSLAWINHQSSSLGISGLPLLAASFSSGIAVYHIVQRQHQQSTPVRISPLASAKFISTKETSDMENALRNNTNGHNTPKSKIGWYHNLGPRYPPCLSLLFEHEKCVYQKDTMDLLSKKRLSRLCLVVIDIPWYGSVENGMGHSMRSMGVICQRELEDKQDLSSVVKSSILGSGSSVSCYSLGKLLICEPTLISTSSSSLFPNTTINDVVVGGSKQQNQSQATMVDGYFSSLSRPVASASLGLDSDGSVYHNIRTTTKKNKGELEGCDYEDAMLTVFSVTSCVRNKVAEIPGGSTDGNCWSKPSQRHWLLISSPGDDGKINNNNDDGPVLQNNLTNNHNAAVGGDGVVKAGATADILFELTCGENPVSGLIPERIVKEPHGGRRVAIVFSSGFFGGNYNAAMNADYDENGSSDDRRVRTHTQLSSDAAVAYTILNMSDGIKNRGASSSFKLRHGRDVAFLPPSQTESGFYCSSLLVLDADGTSLSITTAITSENLPEGENERFVESIQKCSLSYEGIVGRRVFALLNNNGGNQQRQRPPEILIVGYSTVVERPCLLLSKHRLEFEDGYISSNNSQLTLVEDVGLGHRFWLRPGEEIISVVELSSTRRDESSDEEGSLSANNVAVASQERVMILSIMEDGLSIIAEMDNVHLTCASLSPLGSHCVAFCAASSSSGRGGASSSSSVIMYLSCLENDAAVGSHGIIATLPPGGNKEAQNNNATLLAAIRPDRCVYMTSHGGLRMIVDGDNEEDNEHAFLAPLPHSRPLLLLEPLIANALCQDGNRGKYASSSSSVQLSLRTIIEKFGRKDMSYPHVDDQGIGMFGAGVTSKVYDMLALHKCNEAASILLTGNAVPSSDNVVISQPKILPSWIPMQSKLSAAASTTGADAELMMQLLSYGDSELADYFLRHSDRDRGVPPPSNIPGPFDLSSILAEELAFGALLREENENNMTSSHYNDAIKLLDLAGRQSSESLLCQLALSLGTSPLSNQTLADSKELLEEVVADGASGNNNADTTIICKHAKLCSGVGLRAIMHQSNGGASLYKDDGVSSVPPLSQLSPSVQIAWESDRIRNATISNNAIEIMATSSHNKSSSHSDAAAADPWKQPINKNKHVWSAGPFGKKERLLELDDFEDWLGRRRPIILGKEGVAVAADTGERTLAEILSSAARDEEEDSDDGASDDVASSENNSLNSRTKNWVQGVGEGRLDEDNLSLYIRFSEGADEDGNWKADGFTDLSKHGHLARLYGSELASVEATTSSVDEGEEGKVRLLYDLVYHDDASRHQPTGLVVEAPRGGSLDVGMLHSPQHTSRRRCTIELWYHLPQEHLMTDEIILVRRSLFYEEEDDASKLCMPDEKHNTLWELAVLPTGFLELRTGAGSVVTSAMFIEEGGDDDDDMDGLVAWEREDGGGGWNHVCLVFSSLQFSSSTEFSASILMNGAVVVPTATLSVNPFGSEPDQDLNQDDIEDVMENTVLIFGIGPSLGFRMTDLRVWACERSEDDIKMMMYEYLRDAEIKRKLKVNIRKGAKKLSTGGLLAPLPIRLSQPDSKRGFALAPPPGPSPAKRSTAAPVDAHDSTEFMPSFANFGDDVAEEEEKEEEAQTSPRADESETPDPQNDQMWNDSVGVDAMPRFASEEKEEEARTSIRADEAETSDPQNNQMWNDLVDADAMPRFANVEENVENDPPGPSPAKRTMPAAANAFMDPSGDAQAEEVSPGFANFEGIVAEKAQASNEVDEAESVQAGITTIPSADTHDQPEETPILTPFSVSFSDLLSTKVRRSAAAAIIRGPPAARHFGGNRGGLPSDHVNFGSKCDGVGPIIICGADKSIVWYSDRDPPGRTYPIGASGAVLSDIMDENQSEYMCCFLAKEKRMVVFELSRKTVVVELQMKTKLNFWRYLPPEAHGSDLAFVLITPIGGFHWKPLDESPRPCQVWKRGPELESKKILIYEEGGSNGQTGSDARSTVALVIASSATPRSTTVEAYCIAMNNGSSMLCVSNVILGAALYRPTASGTPTSHFLPYVITISKDVTSQYVLDMEDLTEDSGALVHGNIIASTVLDMGDTNLDDSYEPPSMSMGSSPEALCCCHDGFIVAVIRRKGLVFAYDFSNGDLILVGQSRLGQYVVDAAIRSSNVHDEVELILLLCESDDPKDGRVATVNISHNGVSSQYLSSI